MTQLWCACIFCVGIQAGWNRYSAAFVELFLQNSTSCAHRFQAFSLSGACDVSCVHVPKWGPSGHVVHRRLHDYMRLNELQRTKSFQSKRSCTITDASEGFKLVFTIVDQSWEDRSTTSGSFFKEPSMSICLHVPKFPTFVEILGLFIWAHNRF
jgi:hypothetical protein